MTSLNPLPPIPTPRRQRWQDFRLNGIPAIIFLATAAAVVFIWTSNLVPSTIVGEVQGVNANIVSATAGMISELSVDQFDRVTRGQALVNVSTVPLETLDALLAAARTDLQVLRVRMIQDQSRSDHQYLQLRINLLDQKILLELSGIRLQQAESEFTRMSNLFTADVIQPGLRENGDSGYEVALRDRDALRVEVQEKTKLVAETEQMLVPFRPPAAAAKNPMITDAIDAAISAKEEQIRRTEGTTILKSPMDGVVSVVLRRPGENIVAGEPILTISSERPEKIIGFVRQPIAVLPKIGDRIEVRTRSAHLQRAFATVLKVGPRLELFSQPLRVRGFDSSQERGLPILINLPDGLKVHPGEIVDLILR